MYSSHCNDNEMSYKCRFPLKLWPINVTLLEEVNVARMNKEANLNLIDTTILVDIPYLTFLVSILVLASSFECWNRLLIYEF